MRRREVFGLVALALAWPVIAHGQQSRSQRRIGILNPESASLAPLPAFLEELRSLGWRDRENVLIDIRSAEGRYDLVAQLASELVRAQPDVIYTLGPDATLMAAAATKTLPIVAIDLESDPITTGLVENLARPGRNVTGLFLDLPELAGKWLELLGETVPQLTYVGVLGSPRINKAQFAALERAAAAAKYRLRQLNVDDSGALPDAFETAAQARVQGVVVLPSPLVLDNRVRIASLALERGLPTVFLFAQAAEAGGLIAYGPSVNDMSRRAARLVMKEFAWRKAFGAAHRAADAIRVGHQHEYGADAGVEGPCASPTARRYGDRVIIVSHNQGSSPPPSSCTHPPCSGS